MNENDYLKYRGKCKEFCEELVRENPDLTMVRGHYWCPNSNKSERLRNNSYQADLGNTLNLEASFVVNSVGKKFQKKTPNMLLATLFVLISAMVVW